MDNISERIRYLRDKFGLTQLQVAEKVGVVENTVAKWEQGGLKPGRDKINKLVHLYNTTADFILGNTASEKVVEIAENQELLDTLCNVAEKLDVDLWEMVDAIKENKRNEDPEGFKKVFKDQSEHFLNVPVIQLTARAGTGTEYFDIQFDTIDTYPIDKRALLGHSWQNNGFYIIKIEGDSMEPRFVDGDMVLLSIDEEIRSGDIAVVCWDYRFYIRGFFLSKEGVVLRPLNKKYSDIEIGCHDERFRIVGKVIAVILPPQMVGGYY